MSLFTQNQVLVQAKNAMLADNWWLVALRGAMAVLFGIIAFIVPGATMLALVLVFAAYSFVDGIIGVVSALRGARKSERWGFLLVNGLLGIAIGIAAAVLPGITVLAFILMVGAWALLSGGLLLAAAFGLKTSHGRWLLVLGALLSMAYGVLLFAAPMIGALVLTWWIGAHAVVFGAVLIVLAFRLRKHRGEQVPTALAAAS